MIAFFNENPEAAGDMWALYGVDVYGPFRIRLVEALLERLNYEPNSLWRANQLGGPEWFGWGTAERMMADLIDRASMSAKAGGKIKPSEVYPRPDPASKTRVVSTKNWGSIEAMFASM